MKTPLAAQLALLAGQDPAFRPRRLVTRGGRRVRGIFPSKKFNRRMHWESSLERDLIHRLEASWLVIDACTQPTTINIRHLNGTNFDYTPDVLVSRQNGQLTCVECKPAHRLQDDELDARLRSISLNLEMLGVRFVIATEQHVANQIVAKNSRALSVGRLMRMNASQHALISQKISGNFPETFSALCELTSPNDGLVALARGLAYFDVNLPLTGATRLFPTLQETCDAAHFLFA